MNKILKLYRENKLYDAKNAAVNELNEMALRILEAKKIQVAQGFFQEDVDELDENQIIEFMDSLEEEDLDEFFDSLNEDEMESLKEFVETGQLDELSKKTLGNYIKRSSEKAAVSAMQLGQKTEKDWDPAKLASKRLKGVKKATDRLTKEDMDKLLDSLNTSKKLRKKEAS